MFAPLVHVLCFGFAGGIAYVARPKFSDPNLFSWHPTLMTLAFTFLAAEAVLTLSRNSLLGSAVNRNSKVTGHLIMALAALACAVLGFFAVYLTKEKYERPHLKSPHAIVGFLTVCYMFAQSFAGTSLLFPQFIGNFINPRQMGRIHGLSGSVLLLLSTLALIGGINTDWFKERVTGLPLLASVVVPLVIYAAIARQVWFKVKKTAVHKSKKQS